MLAAALGFNYTDLAGNDYRDKAATLVDVLGATGRLPELLDLMIGCARRSHGRRHPGTGQGQSGQAVRRRRVTN